MSVPAPASPAVALTIAGSDCSAGAGIQADLKTFTAAGVYGLTAVTCVVAEVPGDVVSIQPVDLSVIREQIECLAGAFPVAAIKTGMLHTREIISLVAACVRVMRHPSGGTLPDGNPIRPALVVDPVMIATSGEPLLEPDAIEAYTSELFPLATLITPNLDEAAALLGRPLGNVIAMRIGGRELADRYQTPVLLKGGHLGGATATDLLVYPGGRTVEYTAAYTPGVSTHGTGCTMSAAIAACLAIGMSLEEACNMAKEFVSSSVLHHFRWQTSDDKTVDALNHYVLPD
ncbi:MAG: bifunctional hydroxymethylpyrimidine kinase/phosphomethylpyrimidine kinase [Verrucomicrobia bacterium]|nr:bifunctional hydroxymethylpyrimidine kinase/phosphomethylpyrimidine kinase [Verrucomicrobiota bacterium]